MSTNRQDPRSWVLPTIPEDVTGLVDRDGVEWLRVANPYALVGQKWWWQSSADYIENTDSSLLYRHGPLTEVIAEGGDTNG